MRKYALVAVLLAVPALAEGPLKISIQVGEQRPLCQACTNPICDNPKVATVSADGRGILTGVGPGKTLCSVAKLGTLRQVYEIEVKTATDAGK